MHLVAIDLRQDMLKTFPKEKCLRHTGQIKLSGKLITFYKYVIQIVKNFFIL